NDCILTYKGSEYRTAMPGRNHIYNAAAAIEAALIAAETYDRIDHSTITDGIAHAVVPSRMQIISHEPEIIIDGAHNPDAMKRLAEFTAALPYSPKVMICGMNSSKDHENALKYISPYIDYAYCIDDFCPGTVDAGILSRYFVSSQTAETAEALKMAREKAGKNGLIIIAGSLYIAGKLFGGNKMTNRITVNEQNSIRIDSDIVIRVDPFRINDAPHDADIIFITHEHFDHFSPEDIDKVRKDTTIFVAPASMENILKKNDIEDAVLMSAGTVTEIRGIRAEAVAAYNLGKKFHPFENEWLGYIITVEGKRIYIAGDTDATKEARSVSCDIAMIPIGGTYTMDVKEAADLINTIKPGTVIPTHYGSVVGSPDDGERFAALVNDDTNVEIKL
ncbi:MAG: MBL fold metallo-hydrolase, partial [Oscillospiraceae bacterium]|nr:MBL fold metallo-hydrolase [Oscillospiraceae bacterium]